MANKAKDAGLTKYLKIKVDFIGIWVGGFSVLKRELLGKRVGVWGFL